MRILSIVACLLLSNAVFSQHKLINPILPGFYPDPSVVKVDKDYYLINSTFSYFPGIPVFHSKDLNNWKQVGNAIDRPSQMDFMGERLTRGLFAPAINYHKGTYYITCTDIDNSGNFVITATNPAGPWSDPVVIPEVHGIDPSLFFDDDKAYIIYNSEAPDNKSLYEGHRTVRMYEFNAKTLKVKGGEVQLVNGGVDISKKPVWIEGPHIYKRNGFYYLLAAEGGTSVNHTQVAFRSDKVTGPYVPYDKNPILTQKGLDPNRKNPVTSTGHADLVEGPDGQTYAVFLGVRPYEGDYYNTGRETFIAPVRWTNNWPVINPDHEEVQYAYDVKFPVAKPKDALVQKDRSAQNGNFKVKHDLTVEPDLSLLFLRTKDASWYKAGAKGLAMNLLPETSMDRGNAAFIGRRQQHLICEATTEMDFEATAKNEKAGFMILQDELHFYFIGKSVNDAGKPVVQLFKGNPEEKAMDLITESVLPEKSGKLQLKISAHNDKYFFSYATKGGAWKPLGSEMDGKFLSTKVAGGFLGSLFGMYATSTHVASTNKATFSALEYSGSDVIYK
jgi:alpha-N-arabinofuranosidase